MQRSCKTEGVLAELALDALRAAGCEAFEVMEGFGHAAEAVDDLDQRADAAEFRRLHPGAIEEGEARELPRAVVDQEVHAMLGHEDVRGEACAGERVGVEVFELLFVFKAGDQPVDVIARDFSEPRDGVEREQDAQEGQQQ